jgi:hypothetical protein
VCGFCVLQQRFTKTEATTSRMTPAACQHNGMQQLQQQQQQQQQQRQTTINQTKDWVEQAALSAGIEE